MDTTTNFGPQHEQVAALIERAGRLTETEADRLYAAWYGAWAATRFAARFAAWDAALEAALDADRDAAWNAARDASLYTALGAAWNACALIVRGLIPTKHYDPLTRAWRTLIGPIHPEDPDWGLTEIERLAFLAIADANSEWPLADCVEAAKLVAA